MDTISFDPRLLDYVGEIQEGGWGRTRAFKRIRADIPNITEAEVRRLLRWMERNPIRSLTDENVEDVANEQVDGLQSDLYRRYEATKSRRLQKDAEKWHRFDKEVLSRMEAVFERRSTNVPRLEMPESKDPYIVVTSATDFHWGMYAWEGESHDPYDREEAHRRLVSHTKRILKRLPGRPEEIWLAVGSDFYHVDGDRLATTRGTPMDAADGTPLEILVTGLDAQIEQIEMLRQIAPVRIFQMAGNHDRVFGYATLLVLDAWARNVEGVTVERDFHPRVYRQYGDTLVGLSHGDGANVNKLASCMAVEAREQWGSTSHRAFFGGHKHCQRIEESNGITYYQLRSLAGTDRWHAREGWVGAKSGLDAYLIDKEDGVVGAVFSTE